MSAGEHVSEDVLLEWLKLYNSCSTVGADALGIGRTGYGSEGMEIGIIYSIKDIFFLDSMFTSIKVVDGNIVL